MLGGLLNTIWSWATFIYDALLGLLSSDELVELMTMAMPIAGWAFVGASAFVVAEGLIRLLFRSTELSLVSLLYFLSLPVLIARPWLKRVSKPATDPSDEEPEVPLDLAELHAPSMSGIHERSAAERLELALLELGVPLSASDREIRRAYLKHVRELHPRFLKRAPRATQEISAAALARIREAYEVALGRPQ